MKFDIKAFLRLMKQSWRGGGVKIQRTEHRGLWDSFSSPARAGRC